MGGVLPSKEGTSVGGKQAGGVKWRRRVNGRGGGASQARAAGAAAAKVMGWNAAGHWGGKRSTVAPDAATALIKLPSVSSAPKLASFHAAPIQAS